MDASRFSPRGAAQGKGAAGGVLRLEVAQPSPSWLSAELHDIRCWGGTGETGSTAAGTTSTIPPAVSSSPSVAPGRQVESDDDGGSGGVDTAVASMRAWPTPRREPNANNADSTGRPHPPNKGGLGVQSSMLAMCGLAGIRRSDLHEEGDWGGDGLEHEIEAARRQAAWARQRTAPPVRSPFEPFASSAKASELRTWRGMSLLDNTNKRVAAEGSVGAASIQRELQALFDALSRQLTQFRASAE